MSKATVPLTTLRTKLNPPLSGTWQVGLQDAARSVMTDFAEHGLVSVSPHLQIDKALEVMKNAGVRSAFVVDDNKTAVLGLITAYDILGEKPIRHLQTISGTRDDVQVVDVMDNANDWEVARLADLEGATVATMLELFQKTGRTHIAVVEGDGEPRLRGVFSSAKLLRLTTSSRKSKK